MAGHMNQFQSAINDAGLGTPDIIADGLIHRFRVDGDKSGTRNGWYIFYLDAVSGGAFGSWKTGYQSTWSDKSKSLNNRQQRDIKAKIAEDIRKRKLELQRQYSIAAEDAQAIWNQSAEALFHPYLKNKRVLPFGIRQRNNLLIIPLYDTDHKIWSYQSIDESGCKRFMKAGKVSGNFYQIGEIKDQVYISEGFSTGATLNQVLNVPVVVAFNAGNLKAVAIAVALKYPQIKITLAADNDTDTAGNPGLTKAREAAAFISSDLIYPNFNNVDGEGSCKHHPRPAAICRILKYPKFTPL